MIPTVYELAKAKTLDNSTRRPLQGEARVQHENDTPEKRAARATAKFANAEADLKLRNYLGERRARAHQDYIASPELALATTQARQCLTVDETSLRALLRQAWQSGFSAGAQAMHDYIP